MLLWRDFCRSSAITRCLTVLQLRVGLISAFRHTDCLPAAVRKSLNEPEYNLLLLPMIKPRKSKSTNLKPESTNGEPVKPAVIKPEPAKPVHLQPESPKPVLAKTETPKPAHFLPQTPKPVLVKTEPPKPAPVEPAAPKAVPPSKSARVSLELVQPGAKTVYVAGSFNHWKPEQTPLVQKGNGRWVGDLAVPPGRHEYLFVVDGQWLPDPKAPESVQNPFGGRNSVLVVSA